MNNASHHWNAHAQIPSAMLNHRKKILLVAASFLSCSLVSPGFAQEKAPAGPTDNVLASLSLKDGSFVQFNETNPGEIVVSVLTPMAGGASIVGSVSVASLEQLDAVGKFKALAGGAAVPAALVQAQARVKAAAAQSVARDGKPTTATRSPASAVAMVPALAGSTFQSNYCPNSGYSFNFCLLNRTGSGYVQRSAKYMKSTVNAYKGNVGHKLQYRSCILWSCSWKTNISWTVPQGYTQSILVSGSKKTRKASTYEASGDGYHWAVFGK